MEEVIKTIIPIGVAIVAGVIAGNGAVYAFNRIPASWLCDYGQAPSPELLDKFVQRVKSYPWKAVFSMFFVVTGIYLFSKDMLYGLPAIVALWLLLEIAIADKKYMIIPDQFIILLGLTAFGFIPYVDSPKDMIFGALLGGGCMLVVSIAGKLFFKKDVMGFGDVKLFAALGLCLGTVGTAMVLIGTSLLSCVVFGILLVKKKVKRGEALPLGPYIAAVAGGYIIFS